MNIYRKIYNEIKKYDKIIITSHIRADGDCVGSAIALREIIKESFSGKTVKASYENVHYLKFLGKSDTILDSDFEDSLIISVDNAELSRSNDKRVVEKAKNIIKIDHHPNLNPFGYINFVEEEKCACSEMIFDFFLNIPKRKISMLGLEAIYTGIMTDSGNLKYPSVTGDTFKKIGLLYDLGVDGLKIRNILDEVSIEELRFKGYVLENMKTTKNGVLYILINNSIREKYNIEYDDASNMVNALQGVKDHPIWVLINEYKTDEIRCRIRSLNIPINEIAAKFGGGGHKNASGVVLKDYESVDRLLDALDNLLERK